MPDNKYPYHSGYCNKIFVVLYINLSHISSVYMVALIYNSEAASYFDSFIMSKCITNMRCLCDEDEMSMR